MVSRIAFIVFHILEYKWCFDDSSTVLHSCIEMYLFSIAILCKCRNALSKYVTAFSINVTPLHCTAMVFLGPAKRYSGRRPAQGSPPTRVGKTKRDITCLVQ